MPDQETIDQQRERLRAHRRTLAHLLDQQALHTDAYTPPAVAHGIASAHAAIRRIKATLRAWGVAVDDQPDDETPEPAAAGSEASASSQPPTSALPAQASADGVEIAPARGGGPAYAPGGVKIVPGSGGGPSYAPGGVEIAPGLPATPAAPDRQPGSPLSGPPTPSSSFISYSHRDEDFARRLYERLRAAGIAVWYAPEDMRAGAKLYDQITHAIQRHDKLLLVLSEHSINSEWVITEIRRARKAEIETGRQKLFPIRLVDMAALRAWECFDADSGKDLAVEVREYFIPDFSHWQDPAAFDAAFARLLRDLRAAEAPAPDTG